jgi:insulysin
LDAINEYLYDARLAGLGFQLDLASRGVQMTFIGFNDKLPQFLSTIVNKLKDYSPDSMTFNRFKDSLQRDYSSWKFQQPYYHTAYYANLAIETLQFDIETLQSALAATTVQSLTGLMSKLLTSSFATALIIGNIKSDTALGMVGVIDDTFRFKPLAREHQCHREVYEVPAPPIQEDEEFLGYRLNKIGVNENDPNSAVTFYFQKPTRDVRDYLMVELLSDVIEQPFYTILRTEQQLGYVVYSGVKSRQGVYSLFLTVQSSTVDGTDLSERVEEFIKVMIKFLDQITEKELDAFKRGLIVRKSEPDRRLTSQASRFWGEILYSDYLYGTGKKVDNEPDFNRYEKEVSVLSSFTLEEFKAFTRMFLAAIPNRHLLVSQITSQQKAGFMNQKDRHYADITNVEKFRGSLKEI